MKFKIGDILVVKEMGQLWVPAEQIHLGEIQLVKGEKIIITNLITNSRGDITYNISAINGRFINFHLHPVNLDYLADYDILFKFKQLIHKNKNG